MKKRIVRLLTTLALVLGIGVATATAAHADTVMGPYATQTQCIQMQAAYERGGKRITSPCTTYRVGTSNTWVWKFRVLLRY